MKQVGTDFHVGQDAQGLSVELGKPTYGPHITVDRACGASAKHEFLDEALTEG